MAEAFFFLCGGVVGFFGAAWVQSSMDAENARNKVWKHGGRVYRLTEVKNE
jgi:nitrous oxide reductase accessory protein NosL